MQPRRQLYLIAHVTLRTDVHRQPEAVWAALTGPSGADFLAMQWQNAAEGGPSGVPHGLGVEGVFARAGWEILVIRMPPPEAPTEAFYVALARRPAQPAAVGYFVLERGSEGCFCSEWRADGSRIRQDNLPAPTVDALLARLEQELAQRGPDAFGPIGAPPQPYGAPPQPYGAPPQQYGAPPGQFGAPPPPYGAPPGPFGPAPFGGGLGPPGMQSNLDGAVPFGYRPPPPKKPVSLKWVFIGIGAFCLLILVPVVAFSIIQRREAEARMRQYEKERAISDKLEDLEKKAEATVARARAAADACEKRELDAANKAFARAIPEGGAAIAKRPAAGNKARAATAMLFSSGNDWDRTLLEGSPWRSAKKTNCPAGPRTLAAALDTAAQKKPERWDSRLEEKAAEWTRDIEAKTAEIDKAVQALSSSELPAAAVRIDSNCTTTAVSTYNSTSGGAAATLDAYSCKLVVTWVSVPEGEMLAAAIGSGKGMPVDPGEFITDATLKSANAEARKKAISAAQLVVKTQITGWGEP